VKEVYPAIRDLGGEVLAISFTRPDHVAAYLVRHPLPFPVVADTERRAYQAFALGRTSWIGFFRPAVLVRYLRLMFQGWLPWKAAKGTDLLQLGGDFVLDADRRIVFGYRSTEPTDRPPVRVLLDALQKAVRE
jgi:peroxiredoxin